MAHQGYGLMKPHSHKSKYFYLKDQRKYGHNHKCHHCGSSVDPGFSYCGKCEQKPQHTHHCKKCGTTDCSPDYSICKSCQEHDHYHKEDHYHEEKPYEIADPNQGTVSQSAGQYDFMDQESDELIWVKESCNIYVDTEDTQIGVSLQASLQLAIAVVLNIAIADSSQKSAVSEELYQTFNTDQINKQKVYIYNTKDAVVTTQDTDIAINIQVMLQLLVTIVVMIGIL